MGDQSLELQILQHINSKGSNKVLSLEKIQERIDNVAPKDEADKDLFVKAKSIAKNWMQNPNEFMGFVVKNEYVQALGNDKVPTFLHSLASIDDDANFQENDTNNNISERFTDEALNEAKGDLKNINDNALNEFGNKAKALYNGDDHNRQSFINLLLKFPKKVRTLVECIIRDAILGPTPSNGDDWNDGTPISGGTKSLEERNKTNIDELLIDPPKANTQRKVDITTNKGATVKKGEEVVLNESMLQFKGSENSDRVMLKEIKGGELFLRLKKDKNSTTVIKVNPTQGEVGSFQLDKLASNSDYEIVFKHNKDSTEDASFAFTLNSSDDKELLTKQTFKITVDNKSKDTSNDKSKDTSNDKSKDTSNDKSKDTSNDKSKDTSNDKSENKINSSSKQKKAVTPSKTDFETAAASQARKKAGIQDVAGTNYPEYSSTIAAQHKLREAGYDIDIDGFWGPSTQAAFEDFSATATDKKLLKEKDIKNYGVMFDTEFASSYDKEQVKKIQTFLKITPATGNYDEATVAKVKAFQSANGLVADGIWGPMTMAKAMSLPSNAFAGF